MADAHSPLPPSSAARWGGQRCTASPQLEASHGLTDADVEAAAAEGNAAHWVAAQTLRGHTWVAGMTSSNGVIVSDDMVEAVDMLYADVVEQCGYDLTGLHIEERVTALNIHPDNWGTPDVWKFTRTGDGGLLLIWDFKFGHGFVDAFENWQLTDYVAAITCREEFAGLDPSKIQIVMTVVQPRNFHPIGPIRRWTVTLADLAPFTLALKEAAEEARTNPQTRVGPQCVNCRARASCEALHRAADNVADMVGDALPLELPPHALGLELKILLRAQKLIEARVTGLEAQAFAMLQQGKPVPFFAVSQTKAREIWTVDAGEIAVFAALEGVNVVKPLTVLTPPQARKAGLSETVVAKISTRPSGSMVLVPINTTEARKVFAK